MLYSSDWLDALEAKSLGLVLDVFPDESLLDEVGRRAAIMAANSPVALLRSKELVMGPYRDQIRAAIKAENAVFDELMGGPDNMEAVNAFLEKREPNFTTRQ